MKIRTIFLLTMLTILFVPITASATVVGQLISGPTGPSSNGWFSSVPTFRVNSIPSCPTGASGSVSAVLRVGEEGQHRITLRSHMNSYPRIYRDDQINGSETTGEIFSCPALSQPYQDVDPDVFWQGYIKIDLSPPNVSISSPGNNSNTTKSTITVSGIASDSVSGVQTVTVNKISATVSGNSYSASVPIAVGLNSLIATVTDNSGHTAQSQIVINRNPGSGDEEKEKNKPTSGSGATIGQNANGSDGKNGQNLENQKTSNEQASANKKVAAGAATAAAGVGIASYFGYVPYRRIGEILLGFIGK